MLLTWKKDTRNDIQWNAHLLVLNLKVEMTREPVNQERRFHVGSAFELHWDPIISLVSVHMHGKMAHLGHPHKPVALQESDEKIPTEVAPESTHKRSKGEMENQIKTHHQQEVLCGVETGNYDTWSKNWGKLQTFTSFLLNV